MEVRIVYSDKQIISVTRNDDSVTYTTFNVLVEDHVKALEMLAEAGIDTSNFDQFMSPEEIIG